MSPIMTWGSIDGTPVRIDGSGTPTPGPSFKFPKESRRDELMYKMVDENTKKNRFAMLHTYPQFLFIYVLQLDFDQNI